eukprot:1229276-Amorphochlora_amoeboformis.AAC.1
MTRKHPKTHRKPQQERNMIDVKLLIPDCRCPQHTLARGHGVQLAALETFEEFFLTQTFVQRLNQMLRGLSHVRGGHSGGVEGVQGDLRLEGSVLVLEA